MLENRSETLKSSVSLKMAAALAVSALTISTFAVATPALAAPAATAVATQVTTSSSAIKYVNGTDASKCVGVTSEGTGTAPKPSIISSRVSTEAMRVAIGWQSNKNCYEIQYAKNSNFSSGVTSVKRASTKSKPADKEWGQTLTDLTNNARYYVRIRSIDANGKTSAWSTTVNAATKSKAPLEIKVKWSHTATGHIKISWTHNGAYTTAQRVHIATSSFESGKKGDSHRIIKVSKDARSYTLTDEDLKALNSPVGSGRVIRFRVEARNEGPNPTRTKFNTGQTPSAIVGQPRSSAPANATSLTIASYNVTSAAANPKNHQWKNRKTEVAKQIVNAKAGIVGLQEAITLKQSSSTQIKQLLSEVKKQQAKKNKAVKWKLVRDSRYIKRGTAGGNDGQRILYDSAKYKLLSSCKNKTGSGKNSDYSMSCVVKLPRAGSASSQKFATFAQFQDRTTKAKFWVVSVHLEHRDGAKYDKNRKAQIKVVLDKIAKINKTNQPVMLVGDLNASNKRATSLATIDTVLKNGFVDAATAKSTKNLAYPTYNNWAKQSASVSKYGSRIDFIMGKGANVHFSQYTTVKNGYKASDHNIVKATVKFTN